MSKIRVVSVKNTINKSTHSIYKNFYLMHYRIVNPTDLKCFRRYKEKGIKIDPAWNNFDTFIEDMFSTYQEGYALDRIDNNKGYSKANCQWLSIGDNFAKEHNKPIYEYTLSGMYIREHLSRSAAAQYYGIAATGLSRAAIKLIPHKNSRWASVKCEEGLPAELCNNTISTNVPIRQIEPKTLSVIRVWPNTATAAKDLGIHCISITECLNGNQYTAGNYRWEYTININTGEIPDIDQRSTEVTREVVQLELIKKSEIIAVYLSVSEIHKELGYKPSKIIRALKTKYSTCNGFGWRENDAGLIEQCLYTNYCKEVRIFDSLASAARSVNISATNIGAVCKGKKKSAGGFGWKYKVEL